MPPPGDRRGETQCVYRALSKSAEPEPQETGTCQENLCPLLLSLGALTFLWTLIARQDSWLIALLGARPLRLPRPYPKTEKEKPGDFAET